MANQKKKKTITFKSCRDIWQFHHFSKVSNLTALFPISFSLLLLNIRVHELFFIALAACWMQLMHFVACYKEQAIYTLYKEPVFSFTGLYQQ
jgi:hypothetical protein